MTTRTQLQKDADPSTLRARQRELVIEVSTLKEQLHAATCELIQLDAQLGERRDLHPASSGQSDGGLGL